MSVLFRASPALSVTATPLRMAVTEPVTFSTLPMTWTDGLGVVACAYWVGAFDTASDSTTFAESTAPSPATRSGRFSNRK